MKMKGLSLWQPWASLIATGAKRYETRSWATNYRGPLLICAAKGGLSRKELSGFLDQPQFQGGLAPLVGECLHTSNHFWRGVDECHLPFGKAVAVAELVDCIRTEDLREYQIKTDLSYGDFSRGRYAWKLSDVRALKEPYPIKGAQGLFDVDESIVSEILKREGITQ